MAQAAMLIEFAGGFIEVRRGVFLHLDCAGKQNVVLQVNVLTQIGFERGQRLVERLKTDADVGRCCVTVSDSWLSFLLIAHDLDRTMGARGHGG
jgi:hypothetical protein